jgi:hypothetical protein
MMNRVLKTLKKNNREQIGICLTDFKGKLVINIRVFYQGANGEWLPGKQGLAFTIDKLPTFRDALQETAELLDEIREMRQNG